MFRSKIVEEPKSIIISRTDKIGDLVLSVPAISTVKKMYPKAKLYVLVRKYNMEVVKGFTFIDGVLAIDDYSKNELYKKLKQIKADIFIALYSDNQVKVVRNTGLAPFLNHFHFLYIIMVLSKNVLNLLKTKLNIILI